MEIVWLAQDGTPGHPSDHKTSGYLQGDLLDIALAEFEVLRQFLETAGANGAGSKAEEFHSRPGTEAVNRLRVAALHRMRHAPSGRARLPICEIAWPQPNERHSSCGSLA